MTDFMYLLPPACYALSGILFLAVMGELALCLYKYSCRGRIKYCCANIVFFLLLLFFLSYVTAASGRKYEIHIPWLVIPLVGTVVLAHAAFGICNEYSQSKQKISTLSVKQALDNLNSGICFADQRGKIILINYKMRNLIHSLVGIYPQMLEEIQSALTEKALQTEKNPVLYRFPDGKIFRFHTAHLTDPSLKGFTQTTAQDVTQLYETNMKLSDANFELQRTNNMLEKMYDRLADRIREQETLNLKMRIHDNIGTSLIAISDILSRNTNEDAETQLAVLQNAVSYFSGDRPAPVGTFDELRLKAAQMKVQLHFSGYLPNEETVASLIVSAVHECVTNCVHHARGRNVFVKIVEHSDVYTVTITNDGEVPKEKIKEGSGLSALRQSIEAAGGEMYISHSPCFALIFNLQRKGNEL